MTNYDPKKVEKKWQKVWEKTNAVKIDKDDKIKKKFYVLDMFPYPSGTGLHMGHTESYTASDVYYRFKKMQGYNVLHPQGFDSFGLPAENYAIKTGIKPAEITKKNIVTYIGQMKALGFGYDFDEKAITSEPGYYKWTQWIFGEFFKSGLVYKKTQKTNWCESCHTVIANEQVLDGKCERCGTEIVQKEVPGWFFKITDFSDELIEDLAKVDWPEHTKKNQINWIGKSQGAEIEFQISNSEVRINVFTTRIDTIFGVTYLVVAPEHSIISNLKLQISNYDEVEKYIEKAKNKTELDRMEAKEKTGVELKGVKAINPFNGENVPVFVADYVLGGYGTGAVMAVPAHDERDFEFAKRYDLEIKKVISAGVSNEEECFVDDGGLVNSGDYSGLTSEQARGKMIEWLEKEGVGKKVTNYRLRDWSFSRQRYWGCPIPIVYSPEGKAHLIPEKHLPWKLPEDVDFVPTGVAPLAKSEELKKRVEKIFGQGWTAEYDTMDTFVDSSWYFLRYPDALNQESFCSNLRLKKWLPVDLYIGGAEHTYMHLLFARFFVKAMKKIGLLDFDEPFLKLRHQGMVLDKNGKKMSKSKGNVVNPDEMVEKFGADSVRTYMLFASPLEDEVMWNEENIVGARRFLEKIWKLSSKISADAKKNKKLQTSLHKTIKKVTDDIEDLKYNTAISAMMILVNVMDKEKELLAADYELLVALLSPFAPHITEELWENLGHKKSIFEEKWPQYDESLMKEDEVEMVAQVNGKVRDRIFVAPDVTEDEAKETVLESEKIKSFIAGKEIKKIIFVPGKLINIVV
ncbi:MAG: hypothetical protein ACD_11C00090G0006 [uncultured bacterium]|nr:MAG: hypothetical protein ACD_11C00090G0006 [uncultured bacterium]